MPDASLRQRPGNGNGRSAPAHRWLMVDAPPSSSGSGSGEDLVEYVEVGVVLLTHAHAEQLLIRRRNVLQQSWESKAAQ